MRFAQPFGLSVFRRPRNWPTRLALSASPAERGDLHAQGARLCPGVPESARHIRDKIRAMHEDLGYPALRAMSAYSRSAKGWASRCGTSYIAGGDVAQLPEILYRRQHASHCRSRAVHAISFPGARRQLRRRSGRDCGRADPVCRIQEPPRQLCYFYGYRDNRRTVHVGRHRKKGSDWCCCSCSTRHISGLAGSRSCPGNAAAGNPLSPAV